MRGIFTCSNKIPKVHLVSIEDSSGCKKNLAVPGISVNVRRLKVRSALSPQ